MEKRNSRSGLVALIAAVALASACAPLVQGVQGERSATGVIDDSVITARVKSNILAEQALDGFQVNVETLGQEVLLSGFVDTKEQAQRAVEVAKNVEGVERVINAMVVRSEAKGAPSPGAGQPNQQ